MLGLKLIHVSKRGYRTHSWWCHQMETFSMLPTFCVGNHTLLIHYFPLTKACDAELRFFLWSAPEQTVEQTIKTPVIWVTITLIMMPLLCCTYIFSCDQAAIWLVQSVCLSVRPSVCLSVCHTFFTMFPSSYHHEIFRSYYHGQKWCPCKRSRSEVKGQGHRGQHPT